MKRAKNGLMILTEFRDTYGAVVTVQHSSAIEPRCWIFCEGTQSAPHLSPAQARRVAKALLRFADRAKKGLR